jgi:hypothetical protein
MEVHAYHVRSHAELVELQRSRRTLPNALCALWQLGVLGVRSS